MLIINYLITYDLDRGGLGVRERVQAGWDAHANRERPEYLSEWYCATTEDTLRRAGIQG